VISFFSPFLDLTVFMRKLTILCLFFLVSFWLTGQKIYGISFLDWGREPDYAEKDGYADFPYNTPRVNVKKAPVSWQPVSSVASFDTTWNLIKPENLVARPTNTEGGDLFDLNGQATFGASWKAIHDGKNLYVLLKYLDKNETADPGSLSFEIMAQPASPFRHEFTFRAASDSTAEKTAAGSDLRIIYSNMAYARSAELGGGKAVFRNGHVSEYSASVSMVKNGWQNFYSARWGANQAGQDALQKTTHFWNASGGVIKAVLVMSFDGALSYPEDPSKINGPRKSVKIGDTISFDIKSNALRSLKKVEYFWSADRNNGFVSNYYSGQLRLSGTDVTVLSADLIKLTKAYYYNGEVFLKSGQPSDIEIFNLLGIKVKDARNVNKLNIQDLKDGIYLVRVNKEPQAMKILKQSGR
jgi:hypothetical protein